MNKNIVLQDVFLNMVRRDRIPVTVFLTNGVQLRGTVKGFDNFVVVLECNRHQNLVYKHALSTIIPERPVAILSGSNQTEQVV